MNTRMDRTKLNIGAYYLAPCARSEEQVWELRACGVDFVVGMDFDPAALDKLHRHGVGAVLRGVVPSWWGGNTQKAGKMHLLNPLERYREGAAAFRDHPAVWGIDMGDEPSAADMPHMGKALAIVERACPGQFGYLNLFPSYGSHADKAAEEVRAQLGTDSYREYLDAYVRHVKTDYLCLDFYVYTSEVGRFYRDLYAASKAGRDLWTVLQVNTTDENCPLSENKLQFQAFAALTFGAKNIIWACYSPGWWHHNVLDEKGEKTEQYHKLRRVNREIHLLGEKYMEYEHADTHFVGEFGDTVLPKAAIAWLDCECANSLHTVDNSPLLVGERKGKNGHALMILAPGESGEVTLGFESALHGVKAYCGNGEKLTVSRSGDSWEITLPRGTGVLICFEG
jgi:hypothetical protein